MSDWQYVAEWASETHPDDVVMDTIREVGVVTLEWAALQALEMIEKSVTSDLKALPTLGVSSLARLSSQLHEKARHVRGGDDCEGCESMLCKRRYNAAHVYMGDYCDECDAKYQAGRNE